MSTSELLLGRRRLLGAAAAAPLAGCLPEPRPPHASRWVGAAVERGHRLRDLTKSGNLPVPALQRRAGVLVLGGGVAGLAALRALVRAGVDDAHLLELEDSVGGNSRGHQMLGVGCPLGAHYLPVPGAAAREVGEWLHEIGLLRSDAAGVHANDLHLCHSPQERLFVDGAWQDGVLPSAEGRPATQAEYRAFGAKVAALQAELGFAMPTHHARWTAGHAALDAQTFAHWLAREGFSDERLLAYLDYACRDDYGAGIATVSAWAGIHYFASRHGFHVPGDDNAERDAVFTWPEGNAFLVRALAAPLQGRLHAGHSVLRVTEARHDVKVLVWNEAAAHAEAWTARAVVMAMPLYISQRLLQPHDAMLASALKQAASATRYAPWLVANLQLAGPLLERAGAPPAWDNVRHLAAGSSSSLGYVNARHQSTRPDAALAGTQVITAYHALPETQRARLLAGSAADWTSEVLAELSLLHPDIARQLQQADLMRWGHAMSIPAPGVRGQPARTALRTTVGRVRFAHADLSGYSVFEESFTVGTQAIDRGILRD